MNIHTLHGKYLQQGTAGYAVIRRFYYRYADLLTRANLIDIDDIVHEIFLSLSKTDFRQVRVVEHYVMRAIKLHCWSLLDKAVRLKSVAPERQRRNDLDEPEGSRMPDSQEPDHPEPLAELEGMELLSNLNLFKCQLNSRDARLLNLLIDGTARSEIAEFLGLNMNTLDTNIRRLRIRLADHLRDLGYTYKALEKFG